MAKVFSWVIAGEDEEGETLLNEIIGMGCSLSLVIKIGMYDLKLLWKGRDDLIIGYIYGTCMSY